ncbi:MAG TPA: inositol monophosphatase family protein [Gemmatimonadaceae bacterium]|nr:inositol monophosphatase family protein [Gemmatimonadaceae bacterium]
MTSGQHNSARALLATCVAAAARAAEIIREGAARRSSLTWETKSATDFVSDVDRDAERVITATVAERHADARILGEELSPSEPIGDGLVFVADPLDGTTNFLHGFPWYAVSIGAMDQGALVAGVILNAANGELFTATAGGGARLNGQPIHVSSITDPARALIGTGFPFKDPQHIDEYLRMLPPMMRDIAGLRRPGSAALDLADVACGRFEAFFELSLSPWDIAAGVLIAREAGGIVTDRTGAPCQVARTSVVAGNPAMHSWLLEIVRGNTGVDANPSP